MITITMYSNMITGTRHINNNICLGVKVLNALYVD